MKEGTGMLNKKADFGGWWYIVALVLGLLAILIIGFIVLQAKGVTSGSFDVLGSLFGR